MLRLIMALEKRGLFGLPFVAPATPVDKGLIRLTVHCDLAAADLERIVDICREARAELGWALPAASGSRRARPSAQSPATESKQGPIIG